MRHLPVFVPHLLTFVCHCHPNPSSRDSFNVSSDDLLLNSSRRVSCLPHMVASFFVPPVCLLPNTVFCSFSITVRPILVVRSALVVTHLAPLTAVLRSFHPLTHPPNSLLLAHISIVTDPVLHLERYLSRPKEFAKKNPKALLRIRLGGGLFSLPNHILG